MCKVSTIQVNLLFFADIQGGLFESGKLKGAYCNKIGAEIMMGSIYI
jgi:hypothetical protein